MEACASYPALCVQLSRHSSSITHPLTTCFASKSNRQWGVTHGSDRTQYRAASCSTGPRLVLNRRSTSQFAKRSGIAIKVSDRTKHVSQATATADPIPGDHMAGAQIGALPPGVKAETIPEFVLESGTVMRNVVVAYSTYGALNASGDNAVIVGHSLTSNSNVHEWWDPMMSPAGEEDGAGAAEAAPLQYALDETQDFIVCCNYIGSPYGSTSPVVGDTYNPTYRSKFPVFSMRDQVRAQRMVLDRLGVKRLAMAIGGSMGGMLALEFAAMFGKDYINQLVVIAACGRHTDWAVGIGEAQRNAISADQAFQGGTYELEAQPERGLATARMMAMLSYRAPSSVDAKFQRATMDASDPAPAQGAGANADEAPGSAPTFAVESYLRYQGEKFIQRFDANCYLALTKTLDTHDVAIGRRSYEEALAGIDIPTLVVGIDSDMLYPLELQQELASMLPEATMMTIKSPHGHDSFLIEIEQLNDAVARFRSRRLISKAQEQARELVDGARGDAGCLQAALEDALERAENAEREVARLYQQLQALNAKLQGVDKPGMAAPLEEVFDREAVETGQRAGGAAWGVVVPLFGKGSQGSIAAAADAAKNNIQERVVYGKVKEGVDTASPGAF